MGGVLEDLHVEHGGQATETLRPDAECVDLFIQLDAQLLGAVPADRAP